MLRRGEEFEEFEARVLFDNNAAFYEWPLEVSRGADGTCTAPKKLVDNIVEVALAKPEKRLEAPVFRLVNLRRGEHRQHDKH